MEPSEPLINMRIETDSDLSASLTHLTRTCPHMARALDEAGVPPLRRRPGGFAGLVHIVMFQQISTKAGEAIWQRLLGVMPEITAEAVHAADDETLRLAGLSRPKQRTIRAVAAAVVSGSLDLEALHQETPESISAELVKLHGIGRWTADIYCLSCLGHADAWPAGDLALQIAAADLMQLESRPDIKALDALGERWRPYRAVAARILWRHYGWKRETRNPDDVTA